MANFLVQGEMGGSSYQVDTMDVASGTTASIAIGDMVTVASGYAAKSVNAAATNAGQFGIALSASTETASAAGTVLVAYSSKGLVIAGKAAVPGSLSQTSKYGQFRLAVSGAVQTVNQSAAGKIMVKSYDNTTAGNVIAYLPWSLA